VSGATGRFFPDPDERAKRRRIVTGARLDDQTTKRWRNSLSFAYSEFNFLNFDPVAQDLTRPDTPIDVVGASNDRSDYFNNHHRRRGLRYQTDLLLLTGHFITAGLGYEEERAVLDSGFAVPDPVAPMGANPGEFLLVESLARYGVRRVAPMRTNY